MKICCSALKRKSAQRGLVRRSPARRGEVGAIDILALLGLTLFLLVLPAVTRVVKERQEIRKEAYAQPCTLDSQCTGPNEKCLDGYCQYVAPPGGCPPGCCGGPCGECPAGQTCDIPNGACASGKSCNPLEPGQMHKECRDGLCVVVPSTRAGVPDTCTSHAQCQQPGGQDKVCEPNQCCGEGLKCNAYGTSCNVTGAAAADCKKTDWICTPGECCDAGKECDDAGKCTINEPLCLSENSRSCVASDCTPACDSQTQRCEGVVWGADKSGCFCKTVAIVLPTTPPTPKCFCPGGCEAGGCWKGLSGPNECDMKYCEGYVTARGCDGKPEGTFECTSNYTFRICLSGQWRSEDCRSGLTCSETEGRCVAPPPVPVCTPDSTRCVDGLVQRCNAAGDGWIFTNVSCAPPPPVAPSPPTGPCPPDQLSYTCDGKTYCYDPERQIPSCPGGVPPESPQEKRCRECLATNSYAECLALGECVAQPGAPPAAPPAPSAQGRCAFPWQTEYTCPDGTSYACSGFLGTTCPGACKVWEQTITCPDRSTKCKTVIDPRDPCAAAPAPADTRCSPEGKLECDRQGGYNECIDGMWVGHTCPGSRRCSECQMINVEVPPPAAPTAPSPSKYQIYRRTSLFATPSCDPGDTETKYGESPLGIIKHVICRKQLIQP